MRLTLIALVCLIFPACSQLKKRTFASDMTEAQVTDLRSYGVYNCALALMVVYGQTSISPEIIKVCANQIESGAFESVIQESGSDEEMIEVPFPEEDNIIL